MPNCPKCNRPISWNKAFTLPIKCDFCGTKLRIKRTYVLPGVPLGIFILIFATIFAFLVTRGSVLETFIGTIVILVLSFVFWDKVKFEARE